MVLVLRGNELGISLILHSTDQFHHQSRKESSQFVPLLPLIIASELPVLSVVLLCASAGSRFQARRPPVDQPSRGCLRTKEPSMGPLGLDPLCTPSLG